MLLMYEELARAQQRDREAEAARARLAVRVAKVRRAERRARVAARNVRRALAMAG